MIRFEFQDGTYEEKYITGSLLSSDVSEYYNDAKGVLTAIEDLNGDLTAIDNLIMDETGNPCGANPFFSRDYFPSLQKVTFPEVTGIYPRTFNDSNVISIICENAYFIDCITNYKIYVKSDLKQSFRDAYPAYASHITALGEKEWNGQVTFCLNNGSQEGYSYISIPKDVIQSQILDIQDDNGKFKSIYAEYLSAYSTNDVYGIFEDDVDNDSGFLSIADYGLTPKGYDASSGTFDGYEVSGDSSTGQYSGEFPDEDIRIAVSKSSDTTYDFVIVRISDSQTLGSGRLDQIDETTYSDGSNTFYLNKTPIGFHNLHMINLPYVEYIGDHAFHGTNIYIGSQQHHDNVYGQDPRTGNPLTNFGNLKHVGCYALAMDTEIYEQPCINDINCYCSQLTAIGDYAFDYTYFLQKNIEFPSLLSIGHYSIANNKTYYGDNTISSLNISSIQSIYSDSIAAYSYGEPEQQGDPDHYSLQYLNIRNLKQILSTQTGSQWNPFEGHMGLIGVTCDNECLRFNNEILEDVDGLSLFGYVPQQQCLSSNTISNIVIDSFNEYDEGYTTMIVLPNVANRFPYIDIQSLVEIDFSKRSDNLSSIIPIQPISITAADDYEIYVRGSTYQNWCNAWSSYSDHIVPTQEKAFYVKTSNDNLWHEVIAKGKLEQTALQEIMSEYGSITELSIGEGIRADESIDYDAFNVLSNSLSNIYYSLDGMSIYLETNLFDYKGFQNPLTFYIAASNAIHYSAALFPYSDSSITSIIKMIANDEIQPCNQQIEALYPIYFTGNKSIRSIDAPMILSVDYGTFQDCSNLKDVKMPYLKHVGDYAFMGCSSLTCLFADDIDTMNLYMTQHVGNQAFENCAALTSVNGRFIEYVGDRAFVNSGVKLLNLPLVSAMNNISFNSLSGCNQISLLWLPQTKVCPSFKDCDDVSAFCNYSEDIYLNASTLPSSSKFEMLQLRGYGIYNDFANATGLKNNKQINDDCNVIGYEWHGDDAYTVIYEPQNIRYQYSPSPDPREGWKDWMHLCIDPRADSYLSGMFLSSLYFEDEYRYYISSDEFERANLKHEYAPKFCGSIYWKLPINNPLYFQSEEENAIITLAKKGSPYEVQLMSSDDGLNWNEYEIGETYSYPSTGSRFYLKKAYEDKSDKFSRNINNNHYYFIMEKKIAANGNIQWLIDGYGKSLSCSDSCYCYLFNGCSSLTYAPELPATTLAKECYEGMFKDCSSLKQAPALPATTLADYCYYRMFYNCTSIKSTPQLDSTDLCIQCYNTMFYGCSSLISATELPARHLPAACYSMMFCNCTSLSICQDQCQYGNIVFDTYNLTLDADIEDLAYRMFDNTAGSYTSTPSLSHVYHYNYIPQFFNAYFYDNDYEEEETNGLLAASNDSTEVGSLIKTFTFYRGSTLSSIMLSANEMSLSNIYGDLNWTEKQYSDISCYRRKYDDDGNQFMSNAAIEFINALRADPVSVNVSADLSDYLHPIDE